MKEKDFNNITTELILKKFKTTRVVSFVICLFLILLTLSFSIYSLIIFVKDTDLSKYAGELLTEVVVLVFLVIGFSFLIKLLMVKEDEILSTGLKLEKTIGNKGILFIILSFYLIAYAVAMFATLIEEYNIRRLIIASISFVFSVPSFYLGLLLLKLNALFYNYKK